MNKNNKKGEIVIDPYNHEERFKKHGFKIKGISKKNEEILIRYLKDMQRGVNVGSSRGKRSYARLNASRYKLKRIAELFEKHKSKELIDVSENDVVDLFNKLDEGTIKRIDGSRYKSVLDYIKTFKAFWHWYQRVMRKEGKEVLDITKDLHVDKEEPDFNYITLDQHKKLCDYAKFDYKVLMWFMIDSGIRSPTELVNVKKKDLEWIDSGIYQLNIRSETSKTFGRKIKLLLCSDLIKKYIEDKNLKEEDFIFKISPAITNRYLSRLAYRVLKVGKLKEKSLIQDGLTMYDFRHNSACYWISRYKNESALKYRFGWKKSNMIIYYTKFLGMKDTITEDDIIDAEEKTKLQKQLEQTKSQMALMEERTKMMEDQMLTMQEMIATQKFNKLIKKFPVEKLRKK